MAKFLLGVQTNHDLCYAIAKVRPQDAANWLRLMKIGEAEGMTELRLFWPSTWYESEPVLLSEESSNELEAGGYVQLAASAEVPEPAARTDLNEVKMSPSSGVYFCCCMKNDDVAVESKGLPFALLQSLANSK